MEASKTPTGATAIREARRGRVARDERARIIGMVLDRRYRPYRRGPFIAAALGVLVVLVAWIAVALWVLTSGADASLGAMCSLVSVGLILVGLTGALAFHRIVTRRKAVGSFARNEDALANLRAGRAAEAAATWEELCEATRYAPLLHTLYVYNLGVAMLHHGDPERAVALMNAAKDGRWIASGALAHLRPQIETGLALCHAVLGDLDAATHHRDAARAIAGEARRAITLLASTLIAARRGTLAEPPDERELRDAEATLMPSHIRGVRLLHAFARDRGDGPHRTAEHDALDLDVRPGELDFLASRWPELRAFLTARGLHAGT